MGRYYTIYFLIHARLGMSQYPVPGKVPNGSGNALLSGSLPLAGYSIL